jgi:hypothetical protein
MCNHFSFLLFTFNSLSMGPPLVTPIFFIITLGKNIVAFNKTQFVNCTEHHTKRSTGDITKSTTFEPKFIFSHIV